MKNTALIFSKNITDPTGASAVIKTFHDNTKLFKTKGINLSVYTRDIFSKSGSGNNITSKSLKGWIKRQFTYILRNYSKNNRFIAALNIYFGSIRPAKKIVKHYIESGANNEIIFVHEIFTCYQFIKQRRDDNSKIIFVMHSSGDTYKMTRIYYKNIEKTFFYKHLLNIEKIVFSNISRIGFVAELSAAYFIELNPTFPQKKVFYVHNGLNKLETEILRKERKVSDVYEICCVGTINERKGQRLIVEALVQLNKEGSIPKVHFSIIGSGNIMDELRQIANENNVQDYITFFGTSNNVIQYLNKSDILILPSKDEGFPIAILEAMRQSLPIVSTKVGGIPEMIEDNETGLFISPNTEGVCEFLKNIEKYDWGEMGKRSYDLFNTKFTVDTMINKYCDIMNHL